MLALVMERLTRPEATHDVERLLEHRRPLRRLDRLRVEFDRLPEPEHEQEEQSPSGELVEGRQFLGKPDRVPPGHDQMGSDLEPRSSGPQRH